MHKNIKNLTVLIVDDEIVNTMLLKALIDEEGFKDVDTYTDSVEALDAFHKNPSDIIIVDYNMPSMDGVEFIQKAKEINPDVLSIMVTANTNDDVMINALSSGANDFITKPISIYAFKLRIKNMAYLQASYKLAKEFNEILAIRVDEATQSLKKREYETLKVLSKAAEYKDPETGSHIARVSHYSKLIAKKIGLEEDEQNILYYAAPLHDIGKIGISDNILLKPGKLTPDEFEIMKTHSIKGVEILECSESIFLQAGEIIAANHHEKWDGTGYPKGLKGEEIHIYGRIVAVADVFDALTSIRPYKKAWTFEDAMQFLKNEAGKHFDPTLVDVFVDLEAEVLDIFEKFQE